MGLISELRRRNVFRMGVLYVVAAWLIMQVAGVLMDLGALSVAIGPWVLVLLVIGFPIALVFSWLFEITPEGLALEKDVPEGASITHITGRRMDFIVISMLTAAVILFAWHTWRPSVPTDKSIAVLPFVNMSADPEQEYFSDGISEELLNLLSRLPELRVVARTSSFQFKGENRDVIEIGQKLNTAFVLEGSVRKAGRQVRITAQLIDASNGFHLWSDTYDRELENIFAVQDEISAAITGALKEHLGLQVSTPPRINAAPSTEAYDAYLRGRYLVVQRSRAVIESAVREFEKAIELDPDYALAHAELAIAITLLEVEAYGYLTTAEIVARATPHAEQAVALDPTLAEAHAATGFLLFMQGDEEGAIPYFERAIQINPNYSIVYTWMSTVHRDLGRYTEDFEMVQLARRLDPLSIPAMNNLIWRLIERNRLVEAEREIEKFATISPSTAAFWRGFLTSHSGQWANAALGCLEAVRISQWAVAPFPELARQFAVLGLEKEALAVWEIRRPFLVLSLLGKPEHAVTIAEAYLDEDSVSEFEQRLLGLALAGAGDYARAQPILEENWQRYGGRITRWFHVYDAAALIVIRQSADEDIEEIVAALKDDARRHREAGFITYPFFYSADFEEGLAAFLAGEREKGLTLIAKGAEDGYFIRPNEAYLQTLYDDPGFAPIRAGQEALRARERDRFLSIVCNDNPYEAVWQPAAGTCEQFAAAHAN